MRAAGWRPRGGVRAADARARPAGSAGRRGSRPAPRRRRWDGTRRSPALGRRDAARGAAVDSGGAHRIHERAVRAPIARHHGSPARVGSRRTRPSVCRRCRRPRLHPADTMTRFAAAGTPGLAAEFSPRPGALGRVIDVPRPTGSPAGRRSARHKRLSATGAEQCRKAVQRDAGEYGRQCRRACGSERK